MDEEDRTLEEEVEYLIGQINMLNGAIEGWRARAEDLQEKLDGVVSECKAALFREDNLRDILRKNACNDNS